MIRCQNFRRKKWSCVKKLGFIPALLYKMLYLHQPDIKNGQYPTCCLCAKTFPHGLALRGLTKEIMNEFEDKVKEKIKEIFDEKVPFKAITFDDGEFIRRYCNCKTFVKSVKPTQYVRQNRT